MKTVNEAKAEMMEAIEAATTESLIDSAAVLTAMQDETGLDFGQTFALSYTMSELTNRFPHLDAVSDAYWAGDMEASLEATLLAAI